MVDFKRKSMGLKINPTNTIKKTSQSGINGGFWGLGWANRRKFDGAEIRG